MFFPVLQEVFQIILVKIHRGCILVSMAHRYAYRMFELEEEQSYGEICVHCTAVTVRFFKWVQ